MKKERRIISGLLIAVSLLLPVIGCNMGESDDSSGGGGDTTYAIGDTGPAGGLIFYIDEADEYSWTYLEVAPESTEWTSKVWGGYGTAVDGADGTAIGTGAQNTTDIVNQLGSTADYAAKFCSDLNCGGYDDWFLPSKDELKAIWDNLVDDGTGANSGAGGFAENTYWSSSEANSTNAIGREFSDGGWSYIYKDSTIYVRAVRAF
jgi:hypothetical protein